MTRDRFAGIRRVLRVRDVEGDIDEEIAFHLERTTEELVAAGMPPGRAREEAERRFGNRHHYRRAMARLDRGAATRRRWEGWWQDVRLAARRMVRSPGLTAAIVLTFALGIGANATMFGIIDRLLLRAPEHIVEPGSVKRLVSQSIDRVSGAPDIDVVITYPDFVDLAGMESFSAVAGYSGMRLTVGDGEGARQMAARVVTGGFFGLLGATPAHGRFFGPEEDRVDGEPVAVISRGLWRDLYGDDPAVIGQTLNFGYGPFTIVGVAPQDFTGVDLDRVDVWLPMHATLSRMSPPATWEQRTTSRNFYWIYVVGRLAPGVRPEAVEAEATALFRNGRADAAPDDPAREARVLAAPLIAGRGPLASQESAVAVWLAAVSLLVLLIACANVANLLLARAIRQQRETGIRLALGISRGRLLAQTLTESLALAVLGAAAALLVTYWGSGVIRTLLLPEVAWGETVIGARLLAFVVVLTLLTGLLAGLVPAMQAHRAGVQETLRSGGRGLSSRASRVRNVLTVSQAAFSVVLLIGAGLFVRSLQRVDSLDMGLRTEDVLHIRPVFAPGVTQEEQTAFYEEAQERIGRLPGVAHAAAAVGVPFRTIMTTWVRVPGLDSLPRVGGGVPFVYAVGPGFFGTLGMQLARGRGIGPEDVEGAPRVAVVNETMARAIWPGEDPLGRCLLVGGEEAGPEPPCTEVVGVVADTRRYSLVEASAMQFFVPLAQGVLREAPHALLARAVTDPAALVPAVQRELRAADPRVRFVRVDPYAELLDPQRRAWQLGATMFTVFGILALVVAAIGLYSVLAFAVAQRTQELGIRAALGASHQRLVRMVLGQGVRMAGVGVLLGLLIALAVGQRIAPLLFETSPRDPLVFGAVATALLLVAALASGLPAWRATRVDPSDALRSD